MASPSEGNDRRSPRRGRAARPPRDGAQGAEWLWGRHAVEAALANPRRESVRRMVASPGKAGRLEGALAARGMRLETLDAHEVGRLLPPGAVHQGLALLAEPPEPVALEDLAEPAEGFLVLLDQVSDPQNVGAVFRSAAAFGARVIVYDRERWLAIPPTARPRNGAFDPITGAVAVLVVGPITELPASEPRPLDPLPIPAPPPPAWA